MTAGNGAHSGLVRTAKGPLVLLFYDGLELKAAPGPAGHVYSQARRAARYVWRNIKRKQVHTGLYVAFRGLQRCLESVGADVRVNDFATARRMPGYPVGLSGYPSVIEKVGLGNPAVFGPGDYGAPAAAAKLRELDRFRFFIQPSQWYVDYFAPYSGREKTVVWAVGQDLKSQPDLSREPKTHDALIYDKVYWERDKNEEAVIGRFKRLLDAQGRTYKVLRYGQHVHADYVAALRSARSLAYFSHHETQGLACQEAMAANIPVFAWDQGVVMDPNMLKPPGLVPSSVPYFDHRCGVSFKLDEMEAAFARFWPNLAGFRPRDYMAEHLTQERAGKAYLDLYARAMRPTSARV